MRVCDFACGHFDAQAVHGLLECHAVLAAFDGVDLDTDDLHAVFLEDALLVQLRGQVEARLAAEVRQDGVGTLVFDDLDHALDIERLDVGHIGHAGIRHDRGRVRVDENDFVTELPQGLAGLSAGIVELAGLTDDDRARSDDHHLLDVCPSWHVVIPLVFYGETEADAVRKFP